MAKRFTDTDKWKRPWFRALPKEAKLVWFYICDNVDHCGVWHVDFGLMEFQTGVTATRDDFEEWFPGKFKIIESDKFFFPSFVVFQQGELTPKKNAHKPIIAFLEKYGLSLCDEMIPSLTHKDPILMGPSISISKGKGKEGGVGETNHEISDAARLERVTKFDLQSLFDLYPRQQKKSQAIYLLAQRVRSQADRDDWERAIRNYARHCRNEGIELRYILTFPNFADEWMDWRDGEPNKQTLRAISGIVER